MRITALGLALGMSVSAPLLAQEPEFTPAGFIGSEFTGIAFTDTQIAELQKIWQAKDKEQEAGQTAEQRTQRRQASAQAYRAVLTPEQAKVLDRNIEVMRDWRSVHGDYHGRSRHKILMGVGLTEEQMAAVTALLKKEKNDIAAYSTPLGLMENGTLPSESARTEDVLNNYKKAKAFRGQLVLKNCDALYALLTPEQQRVAAPMFAWAKEYYTPKPAS